MKIQHLALSLLILLFSLRSLAVITLGTPTGVSAYDNTTTTGEPIVFGGLAGTCSTTDGTNTCDSCAAAPTASTPCNEKKIYDSLEFTISLSSDTAIGQVIVVPLGDDKTALTAKRFDTTTAVNSLASVTLSWSTICNALDGAMNCDAAAATPSTLLSGTLRIGISADNDLEDSEDDFAKVLFQVYSPETDTSDGTTTCPNIHGVCALSMFPGEEKAYIASATKPDTTFPNIAGSVQVAKIRVMHSPTNFNALSLKENFTDFNIIDEGKNISGFVSGLQNNTPYVFKFASIDSAGNIFNIFDSTSFNSVCGIDPNTAPSTSDFPNCPYVSTPGKVLGLLSEDINCFIATAAFGSSWAPPLITFRAFRNQFLLKSKWGKIFVLNYYKYGSQASHWLKKSRVLRALSQVLLWPIWAFAWLALFAGLPATFILFSLLAMAVLYLINRGLKRRQCTN